MLDAYSKNARECMESNHLVWKCYAFLDKPPLQDALRMQRCNYSAPMLKCPKL